MRHDRNTAILDKETAATIPCERQQWRIEETVLSSNSYAAGGPNQVDSA
jgi:hypothetical protein